MTKMHTRRALAALLLGFSVHGLGAAQSVKLNDELTGIPEGGVDSYVLAAGGTRAVFQADLSGSGPELYSVPLDGSSAPLLLTGGLNGTILQFTSAGDGGGDHVLFLIRIGGSERIACVPVLGGTPVLLSGSEQPLQIRFATADRVVYLGQYTSGRYELFSAPTDGGTPSVKLNGTLVPGGSIDAWDAAVQISPDGSRIVYLADQDTNDVRDLYSVPIDGSSSPVRLNLPRPLSDVSEFQIAWDSLGVVYIADQDADNREELYAVRVDGSLPPVKRSTAPYTVLGFQLAAGSDRLIWRQFDAAGRLNLYSVHAISGGTPVQLNPPLGAWQDVSAAQVSADGTRVVYWADQTVDGDHRLYGVAADGGEPAVDLTGPDLETGFDFHILEGTGRVLFASGTDLYTVPLDGSSSPVRLHGDLPPGGGIDWHANSALPDQTLLFAARIDGSGAGLYRSPADGSGAPVRVSEALPDTVRIEDVRFTSSGARAAFVRHGVIGGRDADDLFSAPLSAGPTLRLSPATTNGMPLFDVAPLWQVSSDGAHAAYLAPEYPTSLPALHSVPTDGSRRSLELAAPLSIDMSIYEWSVVFSPDSAWVVYLHSTINYYDVELFSSSVDAPATRLRLDVAPVPAEVRVTTFAVTPDSASVVFATNDGVLYRTSIDGSLAPAVIDDSIGLIISLGLQSGLVYSPDGAWAVYRHGFSATPGGLSSVPLDGHQAPVLLGPPDAGYTFRIAGDSSRVLYDVTTNELTELRSVPIDGSLPAVTLSVPADGSVLDYEVSADCARAVWRTASSLYSAPMDGSAVPTQLNAPLVTNAAVTGFAIDPYADRVVYVADDWTDERYELFSMPTDGHGPPLRLSNLPGQQDVASEPLLIAPGRVVFAFATGSGWRLYSAPCDGSEPSIALMPTVTAAASDRDVALTADGRGVVYVAAQRHTGVVELFHVPIDGSEPGTAVSGPMVTGGDVESFRVSPDGERVIYRADQEFDDVFELFSGRLERAPRRAGAPVRSVVR